MRAEYSRIGGANAPAQQLHPGPEGGGTARLPATPAEHGDVALAGVRRELVGQTALADPRLAADEHDATVPRARPVEGGEHVRQLVVTSDEEARRARRRAVLQRRV